VSWSGSAALTQVMDHDHEHPEITDRLRGLGRQPVDPHVAATHLASLPSTRRRRPLAPLLVGVAAGLLLLALAFVPGAVRDDGTPVAADVAEAPAELAEVSAQDPDPAPGRPEGVGPPRVGDLCTGPPPWAGRPPAGATEEERAEARARDVAEWRAQREAARANGECSDRRGGLGRPSWAGPGAREGRGPCQGPPSFAGGPRPATPRWHVTRPVASRSRTGRRSAGRRAARRTRTTDTAGLIRADRSGPAHGATMVR
jgi:hypothetical protein